MYRIYMNIYIIWDGITERGGWGRHVSGANLKMNPPTPACPSPAPVNAMWITDKITWLNTSCLNSWHMKLPVKLNEVICYVTTNNWDAQGQPLDTGVRHLRGWTSSIPGSAVKDIPTVRRHKGPSPWSQHTLELFSSSCPNAVSTRQLSVAHRDQTQGDAPCIFGVLSWPWWHPWWINKTIPSSFPAA